MSNPQLDELREIRDELDGIGVLLGWLLWIAGAGLVTLVFERAGGWALFWFFVVAGVWAWIDNTNAKDRRAWRSARRLQADNPWMKGD